MDEDASPGNFYLFHGELPHL